jgi:hypothetical protein
LQTYLFHFQAPQIHSPKNGSSQLRCVFGTTHFEYYAALGDPQAPTVPSFAEYLLVRRFSTDVVVVQFS